MEATMQQDPRWDAVAAILEQMRAAQEAAEERLAKLESTVMDEIIGGITKLYDENTRFENIGGLKTKYSELFGDAEGAFKDLYDADLWEKLQDLIDELKGDEAYTDEMGDSKVQEIAAQLKAKLAKLRGEEAEPEGAAVAVEVEKSDEPEGDEDPMGPIVNKIKQMKGSGGKVPGIMGEPRE